MKNRTKRLWRSIAAAAALVGLGLSTTACSGGGAGGSDDPEVLNVGQISDSIAFFPLYVAEENGYFDDEGVNLGERPRLGTGAKLAAALTSGSIDVAAGVITDAFNLHENNDKTRLTGSLVTEYYVDIIVSSDYDGPGADAPLEERVASLVGKNIGITGPGSGTEALVTYLFDSIDKDPSKDATLVNLGGSTTGAIGALSEGQVDALAFFQPVGQMAETQGVGEIYISPQRGDIPDMAGQLHGTLFSTTTALDAKSEQIEGFNRAIDSALKFIADSPDEAADLLKTYLKATDQDTVDALIKLLPEEMASSTTIPKDGYEKAVNFHVNSGLIPAGPEYADMVWDEVAE
ncbi:ABC transporter substrate-binding protein [Microbacterium sp. MPKO10]|uniref:ABC transporter substrate-binding protein n=1 Tax=Microbacterium sp. MPKO10 TaxID=2989818 RepID=UPI002235919C|nr:ABC transporter substrate-binding protein [Microbacterium sp. MPKO10]MCW4460005.1 ABC transporter substrate-binding protein [Microbacterium sp. MPKO10]